MDRRHPGTWPQRLAQPVDRIGPSHPALQTTAGQVGAETAPAQGRAEPGGGRGGPQTGGGRLVSDDGPLDAVGGNRHAARPEGGQNHHQRGNQGPEATAKKPKSFQGRNLSVTQDRQSLPAGSQHKIHAGKLKKGQRRLLMKKEKRTCQTTYPFFAVYPSCCPSLPSFASVHLPASVLFRALPRATLPLDNHHS